MARNVQREVGSGITRRTKSTRRYDANSPADMDELREAMIQRDESLWGANKRIIESALARWAEIKSGLPDIRDDLDAYNAAMRERETEAWYLHSISIEVIVAEAAMAENRPNEAVRAALKIGEYLTELRFKELWEPAALTGKKKLENLAHMRDASSLARGTQAAEDYKAWNEEAAKVWADRPSLSRPSVAKIVKKRLGLKQDPDTIRKKLKKPGSVR